MKIFFFSSFLLGLYSLLCKGKNIEFKLLISLGKLQQRVLPYPIKWGYIVWYVNDLEYDWLSGHVTSVFWPMKSLEYQCGRGYLWLLRVISLYSSSKLSSYGNIPILRRNKTKAIKSLSYWYIINMSKCQKPQFEEEKNTRNKWKCG